MSCGEEIYFFCNLHFPPNYLSLESIFPSFSFGSYRTQFVEFQFGDTLITFEQGSSCNSSEG